ncbi:type I restriction endonuclease subunit R [archaeon]|nr:type I restriction endonuclease subunit R [Nanoarchaeota archaeon]MBU4300237.1 type I restriction endonuclease subunit R [Nanoarchaeota archaeon]MBU4451623.1 type I restriction endonuclease subunit R [Nanoarchaeota archaeon]MCG2723145.1 type I restriction endonuclease subunit R [archaeon]
MPNAMTESEVEEVALSILSELEYKVIYGPDIAPDGSNPERKDYSEVVLKERLLNAINRLNPKIPKDAREEAFKKVLRTESPNLVIDNQSFHKMLFEGVDVEYKRADGEIKGDKVQLFDFENPKNNEFLAVNQFTILAKQPPNRRPDIILFVNGLPLVVIELKNPTDENATIETAYSQLQTYEDQIPSLFRYNEILVISDGIFTKAGTLTSNKEWFMPWKTIDGSKDTKNIMPHLSTPASGKLSNAFEMTSMEVLLRGMFNKETFLDLVRHFIVFEKEKELQKKLAAYHQYHAVNKAIISTINATKKERKAGIVWHTQGSGKSLSMVFYTGKLVLALDNPTIVVLTDRNDLDEQLFGTFGRCNDLLRQDPVQADSREKIKELLKVSSGGIVFTTIQKFSPVGSNEKYPLLSNRENIIVIADEAHRSQYGFKAKVVEKEDQALVTYGFAKYLRDALPNASFIGFTGTPIEQADKSTPAVFGKYVDIYDIGQTVNDGATVRIYYEPRLAKLDLKPEERPKIDEAFEEVTEGEEATRKETLKSKWARLESVVGSSKRTKRIAKDIVRHFEKRVNFFDGKGMIVCMSRRICVDLYNELIKLRPEWASDDDTKGILKVIMTGSASDPKEWQEHIRNKKRRKAIGDRIKDSKDPLKLVIVRDMWLTGFDAPCLHTMYIDKPMQGHGLMQAIARVNRVFKDKPGGLIVDYIGIGLELKKAISEYRESGGKGKPTFEQEDAVAMMLEKYEIVSDMFHGFDYKRFFKIEPKERMSLIPQAMEHILKQKDGKERYLKNTAELLRAFALAVPHEKAMEIKEDVGFFQAIKSTISKTIASKGQYQEDLDSSIKQILSKAIVSDRVVDIFSATGFKKPDISILSEGFLAEVKDMPQKNLAFEMLKRFLNDEINIRMKKNLVQAKSFREMLEKSIRKYTNRNIEAAQVIEELIELARKMKEEQERGKKLKMNDDEIAFYDALYVNDSAVKVLGDEVLRMIAIELVDTIRKNANIDWTLRNSVQAKMRLAVKRILNKYGYPPDKQKMATEMVLEQAKRICKDVAEEDVLKTQISFTQYTPTSSEVMASTEKNEKYHDKN